MLYKIFLVFVFAMKFLITAHQLVFLMDVFTSKTLCTWKRCETWEKIITIVISQGFASLLVINSQECK
jgi:hypothetical protein